MHPTNSLNKQFIAPLPLGQALDHMPWVNGCEMAAPSSFIEPHTGVSVYRGCWTQAIGLSLPGDHKGPSALNMPYFHWAMRKIILRLFPG